MDDDVCYVNIQFTKLLQVCRLIGAAPVHLTRSSRGYMVTTSRKYSIYSTIFICFISAFLIALQFGFMYAKNITLDSPNVLFLHNITIFWNIFSKNFILLLICYDGRKRLCRIIKYLRKINKINAAMDSEYINIKLKRSAVIFWSISTFIYLVFSVIIVYNTSATDFDEIFIKLLYALYNFVTIFVFIMQLQYIYVLCLIKSTIDTFNKRFRYCLTNDHFSLRSIAFVRTNTKHFFRIYVWLCELLSDFNKEEAVIILSFIVFHISNIIINQMQSYLSNDVAEPMEMIYLRLLNYIYECFRFVILVEACHRVNVEDVRQLVSELAATSRDAHDHLKCFQLNMLLHNPVIAPLGLFDVTRTFIPVVLGGIATLVTFVVLVHDTTY